MAVETSKCCRAITRVGAIASLADLRYGVASSRASPLSVASPIEWLGLPPKRGGGRWAGIQLSNWQSTLTSPVTNV